MGDSLGPIFFSLIVFLIFVAIIRHAVKDKKTRNKTNGGNAHVIIDEEENATPGTEEVGLNDGDLLSEYHDMQKDKPEESDGDVLAMIMKYDNDQLIKIIQRPRLYNPVVVEKAGKLLARREAWEEIKDLQDEELLGMTMADKGLYDENVVEAASMELYQRGSEALRGQFMALTPDVVAAIADGTASAPEGIRLAAKDFLDKHLRR